MTSPGTMHAEAKNQLSALTSAIQTQTRYGKNTGLLIQAQHTAKYLQNLIKWFETSQTPHLTTSAKHQRKNSGGYTMSYNLSWTPPTTRETP